MTFFHSRFSSSSQLLVLLQIFPLSGSWCELPQSNFSLVDSRRRIKIQQNFYVSIFSKILFTASRNLLFSLFKKIFTTNCSCKETWRFLSFVRFREISPNDSRWARPMQLMTHFADDLRNSLTFRKLIASIQNSVKKSHYTIIHKIDAVSTRRSITRSPN